MITQAPLAIRKAPMRTRILENDRAAFTVDDLVENFVVIAEADGGTEGLRKLVLDLAIHGHLVERSDDESLQDESPPGSELPATASPFAIPPTWRWRSGRDVFSFVTSGSRGWAQYYSDAGAIFLRIGNLDYEAIDLDLREVQRVRPPRDAEGTRTRVQPGDVLISITGDTGMVGLVPEDLGEAYINQHIALARPVSNVLLPRFAARALTAPSILAAIQGAQRGIKNSLGLDDIRNLSIPIPPLPEQQRIVAKVDELLRMLNELERKQTQKSKRQTQLRSAALDSLASAEGPKEFDAAWMCVAEHFDVLFEKAEGIGDLRRIVLALAIRGRLTERSPSDEPAQVLMEQLHNERVASRGTRSKTTSPDTGPFELPKSWVWARLDQLWRSITDGDHQPPPKSESGVAFLTIGNVSRGTLDFTAPRFVSDDYFGGLDELRVPRVGDLLYTVVGSFGIPVLVDVDRPFCVQRHIAILKPLPSTDVRFFFYLMRSDLVYQQALGGATGIAQPTVGLGVLRNFLVPVPPLAEQNRIVAKVEQLMKLCAALETKLEQSEATASKLAEAAVAEMLA